MLGAASHRACAYAVAEATAGTIRLKLLKIGALVTVSVRRIRIAMASGFPFQAEWALAHARSQRRLSAPRHPTRNKEHTAAPTPPASRDNNELWTP